MYPSALASNDLQRPDLAIRPLSHSYGHQTGDKLKWTPNAVAKSFPVAMPLTWTDSEARSVTVRLEAASVETVSDVPFMPKQKEIRPEFIHKVPEEPHDDRKPAE
mmetsp:Transcript_77771/g.251976  ORF Transcript_77771/g.251976 Transcript_77771/m.251976 type:complete len:105 (-) Transcript_77771:1545-1859(-)